MKPMTPLRRSAVSKAEHVIALAASVPPRAIEPASWNVVVARHSSRRQFRLVLAFAASLGLGVALALLVRSPKTNSSTASSVELVVSPEARWSQDASGLVTLQTGRVSLSGVSDKVVRISTPGVILEALHSRFLAEVVTAGTWVFVEEGEVVLRSGTSARVVHAGESLLWPPSPPIPVRLLDTQVIAEKTCTGIAGDPRRQCLKNEASTGTLGAQAALFELGALEAKAGRSTEAVYAWRESLRRFPQGVLHPEVRLALLVELVRTRRYAEADEVALAFEYACPDDARREDVTTLRSSITNK